MHMVSRLTLSSSDLVNGAQNSIADVLFAVARRPINSSGDVIHHNCNNKRKYVVWSRRSVRRVCRENGNKHPLSEGDMDRSGTEQRPERLGVVRRFQPLREE